MSTNNPQDQTRSSVRKVLDVFGIIILISVLGYYGSKTVQTYLGQQAIDETDLEILSLEQALEIAKSSNKLVLAEHIVKIGVFGKVVCQKQTKQLNDD